MKTKAPPKWLDRRIMRLSEWAREKLAAARVRRSLKAAAKQQ